MERGRIRSYGEGANSFLDVVTLYMLIFDETEGVCPFIAYFVT